MWIHETTDARGFRQWQEVFRWPRKGSHAFYILGPRLIPWCDNCDATKKGPVCTTCGSKIRERLIGFMAIPVFRYEDTDGKDIPEYTPKEPPPLLEVAERWGLDVKWASTLILGKAGSYSDTRQQIIVGTDFPPDFFHELGHAGDARIEKLPHGQNPEEEAVAELVAATLGRIYGLKAEGHSWNYISKYAENKTPEAVGRLCYHVLHKVEKVIELILTEAQQVPEIPA